MKKYKIIYADPPWGFRNKNTGGSLKSGSLAHYETMNMDQLCALPVNDIADDDCVLFMWWVASQPAEALFLLQCWGFRLKTMTGFNWLKTTEKGSSHFGMGFWTRAGSECCLIAVKGKPKRVSASVRSVVVSNVQEHSRKPDLVRDRIVALCGDVPRVELFARQQTPGWDVFGNEVENSIILNHEP